MNDRLEILQRILPTGLLAESISSLATTLGYKSRATLYRIMDGTASTNAVNEFCRKLETALYLSVDSLYNINNAIDNTVRLNRLLKAETEDFRKHTPLEILQAFIMHDYSIFSEDFRKSELVGLQRLEQTDPEAFFTMLAYFYFKSLKVNFYENGKAHKERCAQIIEPLGLQLMELYPSNGIATVMVHTYQTSLYDAEAPILWSCITTLASVLQVYGTPDIGRIVACDMHLVSFLSERTYFKNANQPDLLLIRAVKHNVPGSGYYDVFKANPETGLVESIGVMTFLSDEILSYRDKTTGDTHLVVYEFEDGHLSLMWANEQVSPSWCDNRLKLQSLQSSQSLRKWDKHLSDTILNEAAMLADGHKLLTNKAVVNINLSRSGVRLSLVDGSIYEISFKAAPFLEYILPSNDVILSKRLSDGEIFVSWPQLMHCIPLRLFDQIK